MHKRFFLCAIFSASLVLLFGQSNLLLAQTADTVAKTDQDLAKENVALRRQNAELRDRLRRLETKNARRTNATVEVRDSATTAMATSLATKAPIVSPVAPISWTGFYVGGNMGYSWGKSSNGWNVFAPDTGGSTICGSSALCATAVDSNIMNGPIGGLQAGYNWQQGNFLVGIETDIQAANQKGDGSFIANFPTSILVNNEPVFGTLNASYEQKLTWLGTLRGRVGFTNHGWLVYGTGGLAYGRVKINGVATATGINIPGLGLPTCPVSGICPLASLDDSVIKVGWTAGAGVELILADNWSWKVEYLHVDLGTIERTFTTLPGCFGGPTFGCGTAGAGTSTLRSKVTDEIVRIGINYRFAPGPFAIN